MSASHFAAAQSCASSDMRVLGVYGAEGEGQVSFPERICVVPSVRILAIIRTFHIGKFVLVRRGIRDLLSVDSGVVMVSGRLSLCHYNGPIT
jgi:hypothetical protein